MDETVTLRCVRQLQSKSTQMKRRATFLRLASSALSETCSKSIHESGVATMRFSACCVVTSVNHSFHQRAFAMCETEIDFRRFCAALPPLALARWKFRTPCSLSDTVSPLVMCDSSATSAPFVLLRCTSTSLLTPRQKHLKSETVTESRGPDDINKLALCRVQRRFRLK